MTDCQRIDALVTSYVDGNLGASERDLVDAHLHACRLCRGRVHAEHAVRALVRTRKAALASGAAPPGLRAVCTALGGPDRVPAAGPNWRERAVHVALAASLVLIVSGAFLYTLTERSTTIMAAELTADHLKCFRLLSGAHQAPSVVESAMAASFGWQLRLPEHPEQAGLELVAARPCLYGVGRTAHLMFLHNGVPVSIFMLPGTRRTACALKVLGHQVSIWSSDGRTFVLIAREPAEQVAHMAAFAHASLR